ncbi:hypothetical protein EJ04DRAFT_498305 [Polyplosphaeria fusca]|uniref:4'-phosphopantetheinyl transferase domain-containing protein n=1 Tax=Polyplosphaeria fusca TaxID=682080 RepID=A0A9P4QUP2_9PLEO|nr:hypothetical protein EJ04DRAFT_498305 [Polyplosphaeria fusca]
MPLHNFPFPFKVGTDICSIPRIRRILRRGIGKSDNETRPLSQFLSKLLTWPERVYFHDRFGDNQTAFKDIDRVSEFLAGRYISSYSQRPRALLLREPLPPFIAVDPSPTPGHSTDGAPRILKRYTFPRDFNIGELDGQWCEISISHDNGFATAMAIVPSIPPSWTASTATTASTALGEENPYEYLDHDSEHGTSSARQTTEASTQHDHDREREQPS